MLASLRLLCVLLLAGIGPALAQDAAAPAPALVPTPDTDTLDPTPPGTLNPAPLPPLENPESPSTPAKQLFGRKPTPFPGPPHSIGSYADGCLAGAVPLPITGPAWQVMRLSRNRNWGHPSLIAFLERFAKNAKKVGWNGLLVGDMSQPRGGPMITGHASHQIGLDADIWFTPMPDHVQTRRTGSTSIRKSGRTRAPISSAPRPRIRRSCASSSMPRSRRRCAARPDRIARGWRKCGHGGVTPSISISASAVRPTVRNASRNRRRMQATAAVMSSISGSRTRRCIRRRR
jgi:Penicillin-insensitive murein endopeptidase